MGLWDRLSGLFRRTENLPPAMPPDFHPVGLTADDDADMVGVAVTITETYVVVDRPVHDASSDRLNAVEELARQDALEAIAGGRAQEAVRPRRKHFMVGNAEFEPLAEDAAGMTFAIDYRDSKGNQSRRRITMRDLYSDGARTYIQAYCHERGAPRAFRFDRIVDVIDVDGECHSPRSFFVDQLGLEIPDDPVEPTAPKPRERAKPAPAEDRAPESVPLAAVPRLAPVAAPIDIRPTDKPGMAQRRSARDGIRILTALARSDGVMQDEEITVILSYITVRAEMAGIATDQTDREALTRYLKRQFPSADVLSECLLALNAAPMEEQRLLVSHAIQLMDADGVQDPAEVELVMRIQQELGG